MRLGRDRRILKMPLRAALESVGNPKYSLLVERLADNLKTDRHPFR